MLSDPHSKLRMSGIGSRILESPPQQSSPHDVHGESGLNGGTGTSLAFDLAAAGDVAVHLSTAALRRWSAWTVRSDGLRKEAADWLVRRSSSPSSCNSHMCVPLDQHLFALKTHIFDSQLHSAGRPPAVHARSTAEALPHIWSRESIKQPVAQSGSPFSPFSL